MIFAEFSRISWTLGEGMKRAKGSHVFGKVAQQLDLLSRDQIKKCIEEQARRRDVDGPSTLGEIAVSMGFISAEQAGRIAIVQAFLEARSVDRRFGDIAVENAFLTKDQLADGLSVQKRHFKEDGAIMRIGEILVELKYMTDAQRDAVLKAQARLSGLGSKEAGNV
jgi:hypothetical protein